MNTEGTSVLYLIERLGLPTVLVVTILSVFWWFIRGPATGFLSRVGDVAAEAGRALIAHLAAQTQELRRMPEHHEQTRNAVREEGAETREVLREQTGALFTQLQGVLGKLEQVLDRLQQELPHVHGCTCHHPRE